MGKMDLTEIAKATSTYREPNRPGAEMWRNSLFESFYFMPSPKAKGARGERLAADIMEALNHKVLRNKKGKPIRRKGKSEHDIVVDESETEVKLSLTWGEELDCWTWQQIRDQEYERIIFIGLNPNEARVWWATKQDIQKHVIGNDDYRQHGGKDGKQDVYWIRNEIPTWFKTLEEW